MHESHLPIRKGKKVCFKVENFVLFDHVADGFWLAKGDLLLALASSVLNIELLFIFCVRKMGVEKEGSKSGGGYVGSFFHLFDWSAKSRKKLFSSKSDLSGTIIFHVTRIFNIKFQSLCRFNVAHMINIFHYRFWIYIFSSFGVELSIQGKKCDGNMPMTRLHLVGVWLLIVSVFKFLLLGL